ncbi:MAG: DUF971 domain-containing protein [Magnetococcales bacterium]|nr:DUF971 domain-containing protein [Magnetococcales bacterium]
MRQPIPTEIRQIRSEKRLEIAWNTGEKFSYTTEYLRTHCPCADCQGHTPDQAKLIDGKQDVDVGSIIPVGHYAIKLVFSDGHDTGVFSWETLYELGEHQEVFWKTYLDKLQHHGKRRKANVFPIKAL